ncbi:MAG: hypothetical protein JW739_03715 [Opitutales bacterium]|nr:hypothetical protein [Opitutales bacterium]
MRLESAYINDSTEQEMFGDGESIIGLQASLQSSNAILEILECARERLSGEIGKAPQLQRIETVCARYNEHQREVRDHCLDIMNLGLKEIPKNVRIYTDMLMQRGQYLFQELSEAILLF